MWAEDQKVKDRLMSEVSLERKRHLLFNFLLPCAPLNIQVQGI